MLINRNLQTSKKIKHSAFTLIEVVLVIAILGLVAAATLKIVNWSQDLSSKTTYKKAFSTFNNALDKVRADMGYQMNCYYSLNIATSDISDCAAFATEFVSKLNVAKTCTYNAYSNGCIPDYKGIDTIVPSAGAQTSWCTLFNEDYLKTYANVYVLKDGMIVIPFGNYFHVFMVDINGKKPPNKWGYDIFTFTIRGNSDATKIYSGICHAPETGGKTNNQMMLDAFK